MNIDIKQLLVFESTVNQLTKQYNLSPSIAALRLFNMTAADIPPEISLTVLINYTKSQVRINSA
jgi:hypothetical protein